MNAGAVISNLATQEKYAFEATFPQFSILDPETTFSLPLFQIACGIADTYVHVMEQYLVDANHSPLMDRWAEGILQTLIEIAPAVRQNSQNYEQMSHFMLSATLALNGFISMGTRSDWATHMIGHELTAFTGLTHGETLAIIEPALMRVMKNKKRKKLLQYAQRVWNISNMDEEQTINLVIDKTEAFYRSLLLRTRLSECNVEEDTINQIIQRFQSRGDCLGENRDIDYKIVKQILDVCSH
jgi:NADP-dependent alcohol dehydrogenase